MTVQARSLPATFISTLANLRHAPDLDPWRPAPSTTTYCSWVFAAMEAVDHPDSLAQLVIGMQPVFRSDLTVRYLGYQSSDAADEGRLYHALHFEVPSRLNVVAWIEGDLDRTWLQYRGDTDLFEAIALQMKKHEWCCFAGSTGPPKPHQHIIEIRR